MNRNYFFSVLLSCLIFSSCEKEGPQGPPGNANVQSSTVSFSNWLWNPTYKWAYVPFTWPALSSSIVKSGAVFVYLETTTGWVQLPRTIYPSANYSEVQRFYYDVGTFTIVVQDSDLTQPINLGTWNIKIVAVESSGMSANKDLNWSDYSEVRERFDLAE